MMDEKTYRGKYVSIKRKNLLIRVCSEVKRAEKGEDISHLIRKSVYPCNKLSDQGPTYGWVWETAAIGSRDTINHRHNETGVNIAFAFALHMQSTTYVP